MLNAYVRWRIRTDVQFKLRHHLRVRLRSAIKGQYKAGSSVRDLGCSIGELKVHLENQFLPGMTWDNWGNSTSICTKWHIDHIRPLASFDLTDRAQFLEACHYTNLQPMWSCENLSKGDKY